MHSSPKYAILWEQCNSGSSYQKLILQFHSLLSFLQPKISSSGIFERFSSINLLFKVSLRFNKTPLASMLSFQPFMSLHEPPWASSMSFTAYSFKPPCGKSWPNLRLNLNACQQFCRSFHKKEGRGISQRRGMRWKTTVSKSTRHVMRYAYYSYIKDSPLRSTYYIPMNLLTGRWTQLCRWIYTEEWIDESTLRGW